MGLNIHFQIRHTPSISEIIWVRNVRAIVVCGFLMKSLKKHILKIWKKSWVPFGSYLLDSTADSAQFEWKWAGLAVLFSRYLPNGTHDFFQNFRICFFKDFIKNPQTTIALTFLTHIISGIDGVMNLPVDLSLYFLSQAIDLSWQACFEKYLNSTLVKRFA